MAQQTHGELIKRAEQSPSTPVAEWVIAIIGGLIVVFLLGFTAYKALKSPGLYPEISIKVARVLSSGTGYLAAIVVENGGGATAAALSVEGTLTDKASGQKIESSTASFDYVPARSKREGGLFFKLDPRTAQFEVRALGYQAP